MTARQNRATEREEKQQGGRRKDRKILGGAKLKLDAKDDTKNHQRWFNDVDGRVQDALDAGYDYVPHRSGNETAGGNVSRRVGTGADGKPIMAFLMKKPKDMHEEDQREKRKVLDQRDQMIKHGHTPGQSGDDVSGRYVKTHTVTVEK